MGEGRGPCDCGSGGSKRSSSVVAAKLKPKRTATDEAAGTTKALTAEASSRAAIRRRLLRRFGLLLLLRMVERLSDCNCELLAAGWNEVGADDDEANRIESSRIESIGGPV